MIFRYCDSPQEIHPPLLQRLDADAPGTWLWQSKIDGVRRQIWRDESGFHYRAKNRTDAMPMDAALRAEFESLPWPLQVGIDCELAGRRDKGGKPELYIFDLWMSEGEWRGSMPFHARYGYLLTLMNENGIKPTSNIHIVPALPNPNMMSAYLTQPPISEGLVIRRADSTIIGSHDRSVTNPMWFKVKHRRVKNPVGGGA